MSNKLILSGVQPSGGQVHVGNYLGAMSRFVTLTKDSPGIFCVVDLHALTTVTNYKTLPQNVLSLTAAFVAIGLDLKKTILFKQSDVNEVCELAWYLACQFPLGLLERAHKIKDSKAKNETINSGTFFYPILMSADILLYRATHVPVGADQKQHLEMAREIAIKFNNTFEREVFPVPEPLIKEDTGIIPGIDGRKMSKSYNNYLGLFEAPKILKEKVMKIVTDSKGLNDVKDPDNCNIFALYKLFATNGEQDLMRSMYQAGGFGYGHAKQELLIVLERFISPFREKYDALMDRPDTLKDVLKDGASRAKVLADVTLKDVRISLGIG